MSAATKGRTGDESMIAPILVPWPEDPDSVHDTPVWIDGGDPNEAAYRLQPPAPKSHFMPPKTADLDEYPREDFRPPAILAGHRFFSPFLGQFVVYGDEERILMHLQRAEAAIGFVVWLKRTVED